MGVMATQPGSGSTVAVASPEIHQDTTVKWFLLGAVGYFAIVGIVALIIAAKFVWPDFLGSISVLHLRAHAPSARQRHVVRLAAGG